MHRLESPRENERPALKFGLGILSQVAVISAALYYFGWARTQGALAYFGLDPEVVNLTAADYVLRSVRSLLEPVLIVLLLGIMFSGVHIMIIAPYLKATRRTANTSRAVAAVEALGYVAIASAFTITITARDTMSLLPPIIFTLAPLMLAYCSSCRIRYQLKSVAFLRYGSLFTANRRVQILLYILSACGAFWTIGVFANYSGHAAAELLSQNLYLQPDVVIFSDQRLAINGTGVDVQKITQPESKYKFEYTGLRLLIKTDSHYVLLPAAWRSGYDSSIIISESAATRFDIRSPAQSRDNFS